MVASISLSGDYQGYLKRLRVTEAKRKAFFDDFEAFDSVMSRLEDRQTARWLLNFKHQGTEYGGRWKELTEATKKQRFNKEYGEILQDTKQSYKELPGWMEDRTYNDGPASLTWEFTARRGDILPHHHTGFTTIPFGNIPKKADKDGNVKSPTYVTVPPRPIWDLDAKDERNSYKLFSKWAHDAIREVIGV